MMQAAIDANILLYSADRRGNRTKHHLARQLVQSLGRAGCGLLPLQSLSEFYAVAIRKMNLASTEATSIMEGLAETFPVCTATFPDVLDAARAHREHGIPFWDGMLWSVAKRAGAQLLLSEDFQDGRELEGVRFVDPFKPHNAELLARLTGDEAAG